MERLLIQDAILLAAGFGTRMGEVGKELPKPLLPLGDMPLIGHVLGWMAAAGIRRVAVNVHHRAEAVETWLAVAGNVPTGLELVISDEKKRLLDTGGGVLQALDVLGTNVAFVHNCDSFWMGNGVCTDFARLAQEWDERQMDALRLMQGEEYVGVQVVGRELLHGAEGAFAVQPLWEAARARGRLRGLEADGNGKWLHVGTATALATAERMM